jgi:outer membrane biosynthesis protein TonB
MKRALQVLLPLALAAIVLATVVTLPASAELTRVTFRQSDGSLQQIVLDVPAGASLQDIRTLAPNAGEPIAMEAAAPETTPTPPPAPTQTQTQPAPAPAAPAPAPAKPKVNVQPPSAGEGKPQAPSGDKRKVAPKKHARPKPRPKPRPKLKAQPPKPVPPAPTTLRHADGSPKPSNPGFTDALPGPSTATGVPNFIIRKFRVPIFLLPIYQAAGTQYGIRWEVLAAINEIETDYGRNLNVSSAGALGWMQFMPSTWKTYGVDANRDGKKDPYNPVDAIFAAARYLKAAGYEHSVRQAIFGYNHADWYVDSVMLRARLISGVPADLVGSLTGLTEGRFPVAARARYADDLAEKKLKKVHAGQNAANVIESRDDRRSIRIFSRADAPVVAVNDGVVKKIGRSERSGRYVVLQDVYGNRFMYAHLGSVARYYATPKSADNAPAHPAKALAANKDPRPSAPASAGRQAAPVRRSPDPVEGAPTATAPVKQRLFAHPAAPGAREAGGLEQILESKASGAFELYSGSSAVPIGLGRHNMRLKPLRKGAHVMGGTILGRVGRPDPSTAANLDFEIRPAGRGAPRIDPKPILDGWKLLEATAVYRASGRNVLHGEGFSVGQILLMPKPQLERRVLHDPRVQIYPGGRSDIRSGQIDRRVLATLEYLAESGLRPTVSCLKSGHSFLTTSGNVSEHSSGNAVDISEINGIPILGHQEQGGITETSVRRLMRLQGSMRPHQIISLLDLGANTMALSDHANHIHVGFSARFGANSKLGRQALAVLKPGQWSDLLARLRQIQNPVVPTRPSRYSLPARKPRHPRRHHGGPMAGTSAVSPPRAAPKVRAHLRPLPALKPDTPAPRELKPVSRLNSR